MPIDFQPQIDFQPADAPQIPGMEKLGGSLPLMPAPAAPAGLSSGAAEPPAPPTSQTPQAPQTPKALPVTFTGAPADPGNPASVRLPSGHEAAAIADENTAQFMRAISGLNGAGAMPAAPQLQAQPNPVDDVTAPYRVLKGTAKNVADFVHDSIAGEIGTVAGGLSGNRQQFDEGRKKQAQAVQKPLVPLDQISPEPGLENGIWQGISSLSTPENLAIMGATGGVGAAARGAASPVIRAGWQAFNTALSGYFALNAGKGAVEGVNQAADDYARGDYDGMAQHLGYSGVNALMGAVAGKHALDSTIDIGQQSVQGYREGKAYAAARDQAQADLNAKEKAQRTADAQAARDRTPKLPAANTPADNTPAANTPADNTPAANTPADNTAEGIPPEPAPASPGAPTLEKTPAGQQERWQTTDRQHEIRPLTEKLYDQYVVPTQKNPASFADYQNDNPDVTHASFQRKPGGTWKYDGVGAAEDLRPDKGTQVDKFARNPKVAEIDFQPQENGAAAGAEAPAAPVTAATPAPKGSAPAGQDTAPASRTSPVPKPAPVENESNGTPSQSGPEVRPAKTAGESPAAAPPAPPAAAAAARNGDGARPGEGPARSDTAREVPPEQEPSAGLKPGDKVSVTQGGRTVEGTLESTNDSGTLHKVRAADGRKLLARAEDVRPAQPPAEQRSTESSQTQAAAPAVSNDTGPQLGDTRNIGHGTETLESIPLAKVFPAPPPPGRPQGNILFPDRVEEYRSGARKAAPAELRKERDGTYTTWEGHHRIEAAKLRGDTHITAWTLEGKPQMPEAEPTPGRPGFAATGKGRPAAGAIAPRTGAAAIAGERTPEMPRAAEPAPDTSPAPAPAGSRSLETQKGAPASEDSALIPGSHKLLERIHTAIDKGEDIRLKLEKIAKEELGGSRAQGTFSKQDLYEIQEAAVNRWMSTHGERLMSMPFGDAVGELRARIAKLATQTTRSDEKVAKQQFSTPPQLALLADKLLAPTKEDRVLEPSAGTGSLVAAIAPHVAAVHVNEIDPRRRELAGLVLGDKVATSTAVDGENLNALLPASIAPTAVVMNPPFSAGVVKSGAAKNNNKYGYNHVEHALQRLQPNGRAVIILGEGADLTAERGTKFWQSIAKRYNIRANVGISGKEYAKYGTTFGNRMVVIDKTGPTPGANWLEQLASVKRGQYDSVESAWKDLAPLADERTRVQPQQSPDLEGRTERVDQRGEKLPRGNGRAAAGGGAARRGDSEGAPKSPASNGSKPAAASGSKPESAGPAAPAADAGSASNAASARRTPERLTLTRRTELQPEEDAGAFVQYEPTIEGPKHPGAIVETKAMSTIPLPPLTYRPLLPPAIIDEGRISAAQMEAVILAGQQNEIILPDGSRAAALIGDGTGTGKGRTGAAIALDNWNQGRKRILFVSKSWDLAGLDKDATEGLKRDLSEKRGIGAAELGDTIKRLDKWKHAAKIEHEGVIFSPYSALRAIDQTPQKNRRIDQVIRWLKGDGSDGLTGMDGAIVIFDESHQLKNTTAGERGVTSQVGSRVAEMLRELPKLRTVFMSATAASDVQNMGYLGRLGLWGPQTAFPNGFEEFSQRIGSQGLSAMELIARELKADGKYLARTLSMKGVTFQQIEHEVTEDQKAIYATAAKAWQLVARQVEAGVQTTNGGNTAQSNFTQQFYGASQQFFNMLITALKTPSAIALAQKALDDGRAPVISLVNTLESIQNRQEAKFTAGDADEDELDFGPRDVLINLVREHYPVQQYADDVDPNGKAMKVALYTKNAEGQDVPVTNPAAEAQRDALVKQLERELHLPGNPLDLITDHFGAENVAELSGRKKRWDAAKGKFVKMGDENTPQHAITVAAMEAFQDGRKKIALVTSKADTGISLHSDLKAKNQKQRVHITLQFGWSADKQMQMFGRTNRTNQAHPPIYQILVSDLAGEKRFVSTITKRLKSLGAITRGSSEASGGTAEMADLDLDSREGMQAATSFYNRMLGRGNLPGTELPGLDLLTGMGLISNTPTGPQVKDSSNVNRLMNRILMLPPDIQRPAFDYFYDIFRAAVQQALEDGSLDTGVKELKGRVTVKERRTLAKDPKTGAETTYYPVDVENKNDLVYREQLEKLMRKNPEWRLMQEAPRRNADGTETPGRLLFTHPTKPIVRATGQVVDAHRAYAPTGRLPQKVEAGKLYGMTDVREELERRVKSLESDLESARRMAAFYKDRADSAYHAARVETIREEIAKTEAELPAARAALDDFEEHALAKWEDATNQEPQTVTAEHHLIGGAVLKHWGVLGNEMNGVYLAQDTGTGDRVVGASIPPERIQHVLSQISGKTQSFTPKQVFDDTLRNGTEYKLEGGIRVVRGSIAREPVIEFKGATEATMKKLAALGAEVEKGIVNRAYVPTDVKGRGVFANILNSFKVLAGDTEGGASIDFLTLGLAKKIMDARHGPQEDYSTVGRFKNLLVGNGHQLGEAAPRAHEAFIRTAAARSQAHALIRAAVPRIVEALERNGGPSWGDFRKLLIESRLQGIRTRWERMARSVARWNEDKLRASFETGNLKPLLQAIEGEWDIPAASAEHCASLLESNQYAKLRRYLQSAFEQAGSHVARLMEQADFDALKDTPGVQAALRIYKALIETPLAESHALNEGVFSNALGPLKTYYPLIPVRELDPLGAAVTAATPFKKPRNMANEYATGLAKDYDTDMGALTEKIERAFRGNNKAALLDALEDAGLGRQLDDGEATPATMEFQGREFPVDTVQTGGGYKRNADNGRLVYQPVRQMVMPRWLKRELDPVLQRPDIRISPVRSIISAINGFSLVGALDFAFHSRNLLGTLVDNTPYLPATLFEGVPGLGAVDRVASNLPLTKWAAAVVQMAKVDPSTAAAAAEIREMATHGMIPDKYASVTSGFTAAGRRFAELTGAKKSYGFGAALYGPKGIDIRARLVMNRLAKQLDPNITIAQRRAFVNQLGNYIFSLQTPIERALKSSGIGPFATAGMTMTRNGINATLGTGPTPGGWGNRILQLLTGGLIGGVALWLAAHYAATGKWPWQDRRSQWMRIPVPAAYQHSAMGRALWGPKRGQAYVNLDFFLPLLTRGLRAMGVSDYYNTRMLGGTHGQAFEHALTGPINAILHPAATGPLFRAGAIALTGREPHLTSIHPLDAMPAVGRTKPGLPMVEARAGEAVMSLNPFFRQIGHAVGLGHPPEFADKRKEGGLHAVVKMATDVAAPGLLGEPSNIAGKAARLRSERNARNP